MQIPSNSKKRKEKFLCSMHILFQGKKIVLEFADLSEYLSWFSCLLYSLVEIGSLSVYSSAFLQELHYLAGAMERC